MRRVLMMIVVLTLISGISCKKAGENGEEPVALSDEEFARPASSMAGSAKRSGRVRSGPRISVISPVERITRHCARR
jgi:hypothetical protein